jgi:hypothetical protein
MSKTRSPTKNKRGTSVTSSNSAGAEAERTGEEMADGLEQMVSQVAHNPNDRQLLRTTLLELLSYGREGNKFLDQGSKLLDTADQILRQEIHANNEDRAKQTEAKIKDLDARREAELPENRERRLGKEERENQSQNRKNERHDQQMRERETARIDGSRERNLFMNLTAASVIATLFFGACTLVFLFLTAKYSQPWGYAGSVASLALTGITGFTGRTPQRLGLLFLSPKADDEGSDSEAR